MTEISRGFDALIGAALAGSTTAQAASSGGIQMFGTIEEDGVLLDGAETALLEWPVVSMVPYNVGDRVSLTLVGQRPVITGVIGGSVDETVWEVEQGLAGVGDEIGDLAKAQFEQGLLVKDHEERIKEAEELAEKAKEDVAALGPVIDGMDHALNVELPAAKQQASDAMSKAVESLNQSAATAAATITSTLVEFSIGTETAPGTKWFTTAPKRGEGEVLWQRTTITRGDGSTQVLAPFPVTGDRGEPGVGEPGKPGADGKPGAPGKPGEQGVGVESITPFFAQYPYSPFAPGPGGYESQWTLLRAILRANANDATGITIRFNGGTTSDGQVRGPMIPVEAGQKFVLSGRYSWYTSSDTGGNLQLRMEWFEDPEASRISYSTAVTRESGTSRAYISGTVTAPANAQYARFYIFVSDQSGPGDAAFYNPRVRPETDTDLAMPLPDQPTSATPGGIWQDTEPAYRADTVLFRTEQIKYTDGRVQYTPVTQSSSYQAAENALHVANLAQAAAEGLLTIGPVAPEHGPGKVWLETNEDGSLIGVYQSVDGQWAEYTIITGVLIVPGEDGIPTVIDQNGMTIGQIWADSITGDVIAANTIGAGKLILADIGREYFREDVQDTLGDAEAWADLTLLEPGKITITSKSVTSGELSSLILRPAKIDFLVRDQPRAYIDGEKNLMWIGNAKIDDVLHVGEHQVRTLEGTNITVFQWVGGAS